MPGTFGSAVDSLLGTYTKCLALLKAFGSSRATGDQDDNLRRSLRSDRSKVKRAYTKRLAGDGSSVDDGDSEHPANAMAALSCFLTVLFAKSSQRLRSAGSFED